MDACRATLCRCGAAKHERFLRWDAFAHRIHNGVTDKGTEPWAKEL
jgi:hypothetical protein